MQHLKLASESKLRDDKPAHFQNIRVCPGLWRDLFKLLVSLDVIAQFQPTLSGLNMHGVGWLKGLDHFTVSRGSVIDYGLTFNSKEAQFAIPQS